MQTFSFLYRLITSLLLPTNPLEPWSRRGMSNFGEVFHVERRQMLECRAEELHMIELMNNYRKFTIFMPHRN